MRLRIEDYLAEIDWEALHDYVNTRVVEDIMVGKVTGASFYNKANNDVWGLTMDDIPDMDDLYREFIPFSRFSAEDLYDYPTQAELAEFLEAQGY